MMNDMGYNFCTQCGAKIAKGSFFCTACGHKLMTEDIPTADGIYEKVTVKKGISKGEKTAVAIAILLPLVIAIITFCIVYIPQAKITNTYADLKEAMHIGDKGLYEVEDLLEKLPDDYKDVKKIRYEYEEIATNITLLSQKGLTSRDASFSRRVLKTLREIEEKNSDWKITDYVLNRYTEQFVIDMEWYSENDYFRWYFDQRNKQDYITTTLPGKMLETDPVTYYYARTENGLILGYTDPKTGEKVKQYEVISIDYVDDDWHMEMYCYENDTIYVFDSAI